MDNKKAWVLTIGVLLIFAASAITIIFVVQDTIQRTVSPVQAATGNIGTRVAEVLHPSPTVLPDPVTIIHGVRGLSRLETIQYTVEKVITAETNQGPFGFLFGDRLIFVAHGIVLAGIDMEKLQPEDLYLKDQVLYVRLPAPEVFLTTLDNNKSYVYHRDTGVLTHGSPNLETNARQAAESEIEKAALEDGILKMARQNAESYLERFLRSLGYPEVIFVEATPTP